MSKKKCNHLIGIWDTGLGCDTQFIYTDSPENLKSGWDFSAFNFCSSCGKRLRNRKGKAGGG